MLISRSIISWFAELGEASNQSNSPASIPRTIHQCHHCTGALSSSTSSISSSSLSSSNHHHWSSPSSSSVTLRPKMGQWSFRSRCQICKKLLCTGTQCSTGDQMFLLISIQRWSWYQVATQIFLMMTITMVHSGKNVARPCHSFEALPKSSRSRPRVVPNRPQVFPI